MTDIYTQACAALFSDMEEGASWPAVRPLLAHYTALSTMEAMLRNNELWLSNPLNMNDFEELRFGMNEGVTAVLDHQGGREVLGTAIDAFHDMYMQMHNDFDARALDTYLMCFCEHKPEDDDGLLSMWRGYGSNGSGVAVVFDSSKVEPDDSSPFILSKVEYAPRAARLAWIKAKVGEAMDFLAGLPQKGPSEIHQVAYALLQRLKLYALFTKDKGFIEEREWRLVYDQARDPDGRAKPLFGYFISSKGVEPKLKLKVNGEPNGAVAGQTVLDQIVDRIILGPVGSSTLAVAATKRMFECLGKPHLGAVVRASTTPYRP